MDSFIVLPFLTHLFSYTLKYPLPLAFVRSVTILVLFFVFNIILTPLLSTVCPLYTQHWAFHPGRRIPFLFLLFLRLPHQRVCLYPIWRTKHRGCLCGADCVSPLRQSTLLTFFDVNLSWLILQYRSVCFYGDVKHLELPLCMKII